MTGLGKAVAGIMGAGIMYQAAANTIDLVGKKKRKKKGCIRWPANI